MNLGCCDKTTETLFTCRGWHEEAERKRLLEATPELLKGWVRVTQVKKNCS